MKFSFSLSSTKQSKANENTATNIQSLNVLGFPIEKVDILDDKVRKISKVSSISLSGIEEEIIQGDDAKKKRVIECKNRLDDRTIENKEETITATERETFSKRLETEEGGLIVIKPSQTRKRVETPILNIKKEKSIKDEPLLVKQEEGVPTKANPPKKKVKEDRIDYETTPVDGYGMAILRGMGYDPDKDTTQLIVMKQRPYVRGGLGADKAFEKWKKDSENKTEIQNEAESYSYSDESDI